VADRTKITITIEAWRALDARNRADCGRGVTPGVPLSNGLVELELDRDVLRRIMDHRLPGEPISRTVRRLCGSPQKGLKVPGQPAEE